MFVSLSTDHVARWSKRLRFGVHSKHGCLTAVLLQLSCHTVPGSRSYPAPPFDPTPSPVVAFRHLATSAQCSSPTPSERPQRMSLRRRRAVVRRSDPTSSERRVVQRPGSTNDQHRSTPNTLLRCSTTHDCRWRPVHGRLPASPRQVWDPSAYGVPCSDCANGVRPSSRLRRHHHLLPAAPKWYDGAGNVRRIHKPRVYLGPSRRRRLSFMVLHSIDRMNLAHSRLRLVAAARGPSVPPRTGAQPSEKSAPVTLILDRRPDRVALLPGTSSSPSRP